MSVGVGDGVGVGGGYIPQYLPASVRKAAGQSAPDDHFTAGPDCRMVRTGRWCVDRGSSYPAIRTGIVSSSGPDVVVPMSSPDNHFTAAPDCRVKLSASQVRQWCPLLSNCPCRDHICRQCFASSCCRRLRPRRSFHCQSTLPCDRSAAGALVVLVVTQLSVLGLYLPPLCK